MNSLTSERVRHVLSYDKTTGVFTWLNPPRTCPRKKGAVTGSHGINGYLHIRVDGVACLAHRLAWLYVHGAWPSSKLDHINGQRHDNRIVNLRLASDEVNAQNLRAPQRNNKSGFLGVCLCKQTGRWMAQITADGRSRKLGRFDTPQIAHQVYLSAKRELHAGCTI